MCGRELSLLTMRTNSEHSGIDDAIASPTTPFVVRIACRAC
jgi:hypothetical protein